MIVHADSSTSRKLLGGLLWFLLPATSAMATEIIVDNRDAGFKAVSDLWREGSAGEPWGDDYLYAVTVDGEPTAQAQWEAQVPNSGPYEVAVWYVADRVRSPDAPFTIEHAGGNQTIQIDQRANGSQWKVLGTFHFEANKPARVVLTNSAARRNVAADAVRFRSPDHVDAPPPTNQEAGPGDKADSRNPQRDGEFRGIWVSRFEWPNPDANKAKATIDHIMKTLAEHNFNALMFQVRGQADTFYPSPEEPWSPLISPHGTDPGWDPLKYALEAAHAAGLELHAYINTHTGWQNSEKKPPASPDHAFFKHFNAADPAHRDWLIHDKAGKPVQWGGDNYVWLAPGVPEFQAYVRRQIMYVVNTYAVDGVHFDRIRTPNESFSHDPISNARQAPGSEGNPDNLDFTEWTRNQFTRFLVDLYAQIAEARPAVKVSSSPLGLYRQERYPGYPPSFQYAYSKTYQDAQAWLAAGAMDFIVPQIYWGDNDSKLPDFSDILPDWVANRSDRQIVAGQSASMGAQEIVRQIRFTRQNGGVGNVVFSFRGFDRKGYFKLYSERRGVYAKPVKTPVMPWKDKPTEGILIGTINDAASGKPIVDAQIRCNGSAYTALSSGDGLYAFLKVAPGTYTLTIRKQGMPEREVNGVRVEAGKVTRTDINLGAPLVVAQSPEPSPSASPPVAEPTGEAPLAAPVPAAEPESPPAIDQESAAPEPPEVAEKTLPDAPKRSTSSETEVVSAPEPGGIGTLGWILIIAGVAGISAIIAIAVIKLTAPPGRT